MKFKLIYLLILISTISCTRKSIVSKTETVTIIKDSISYKETVKLDTIIIPADTLVTTFTIECDSITNKPKIAKFKSNSKRLNQTITVGNNGQIIAKCVADSLIKVIASINKELNVYKDLAYTKSDSNSTHTERKYIPKWVWYSLVLNILLLGWTFRKPIKYLFTTILKFIV